MASGNKKVLREEIERDRETGEIKRTKHTVQFKPEPQFIKLYLDCLGVFTNNNALDKSLNVMLVETLKYMTYADTEQTIYLNSTIKAKIAKATGRTVDRYNQALTIWVKEGVMKRVGRGAYQVNPFIFGKGDWRDIEHLRATFNFTNGIVDVEKELKTTETPTKTEESPENATPAKVEESPNETNSLKASEPLVCPECGERLELVEVGDLKGNFVCNECNSMFPPEEVKAS